MEVSYHELDFQENTRAKVEQLKSAAFVQAARELCAIDTNDFHYTEDSLTSVDYHVHAQDLRKLSDNIPGLKEDLPTLILSECCLIYLSPEEADAVLAYFMKFFDQVSLAITIYEPIRPNDAFGKTMVRNLIARGIHLQTFERYAELENQITRLQHYQFQACAEDTEFIWREWVDGKEKERVDGLEWMDEIEEFVLLAKHYCIAWGWRGSTNHDKWKELPNSSWNAKQ